MKKILTILICLIMVFSFVGCGGNNIQDTENDLIIKFYSAGYGDAGFVALKNKFEELNPGTTVTLMPDTGFINTNAEAVIKAGPSVTPVDLMFVGDLNIRSIIDKGSNVVKGYSCALADISDVYETNIGGIKYKDKMNSYYEDYNNVNGKYYSTNWASGANGLAYRADFFEANGWEIPATTDELVELIAKIKEAEYVPFIWPGENGYWSYVTQVWWAQYAGDEEMKLFYEGKDLNGDITPNIYKSAAFLETYKALESCIYDSKNSFAGSLTKKKDDAQNDMYIDSNKICMMPNGSWFETEMTKTGIYTAGQKNIRIMKAPVLSAVLKIEDGDSTVDRFETIKTEAVLRAVVKAVDNGETSYPNVDQDEFDVVKHMRNYVTTTGNLLQAVIPAYSNAISLAKEFLKFMATDEAIQIFYNACHAILPFDTTSLTLGANATNFEKDVFNNSRNASWLALNSSKNKLFYKTVLDYQVDVPEIFIAGEGADKKTGKQFFDYQFNNINAKWSTYKLQAGI